MYHDVIAEKKVFFDLTPQELEADFALIKAKGLTPITLAKAIEHLQTGVPLPEKPILLTFDDGYAGHYQYVYPLLQKYGYPAVFSVYTNKMDSNIGRAGISWQQLKEMAVNPLVTIAAHSVSHPKDLRTLSKPQLRQEIIEAKQILEQKLEITIDYYTYPEGKSNQQVEQMVAQAGYQAALSMNDLDEHFAGESPNLLTLGRFGQSSLEQVLDRAWGGPPLPRIHGLDDGFDFTTQIYKHEHFIDGISLTLIVGGKPATIHADSRYQVTEILKKTKAIAAVDGAFFSLKYLDSNVLIGPALNRQNQFVSGNNSENSLLQGRPLVLIGSNSVYFTPFKPDLHNTLAGLKAELKTVEDAFVAAAWLVKNGQPQSAETFQNLFGFDELRHRAFWGIDYEGKPVIGVTHNLIDSVSLGKVLHKLALKNAVMLDSGASTSLVYQGESLVGYIPRPVPHVVALFPPSSK
jgi:poly-beta-1,6-N-acetyl-D-glucosamine N-deacetylase